MMPAPLHDVWEVPADAVVPGVWFHDHGIGVFPLKPRSKEPACASWDDYACTREQAASLCQYGVRLGATLGVLDTDGREAERWVLQQVADGAIPKTPFVVTTARGFHRYYRLDGPLPKFLHRGGYTLEFRNAGQYVVGAGSTHPSGVTYTAADWSWHWEDISFFPAAFIFDDRPIDARGSADGQPFAFPPVVRAGERHDMLFRQIRSWRHVCDQAEVREAITLMNLAHCHPPLVEDDAFERWFVRAWNKPDRPFETLEALDDVRGL